jgi:hypothetical protein
MEAKATGGYSLGQQALRALPIVGTWITYRNIKKNVRELDNTPFSWQDTCPERRVDREDWEEITKTKMESRVQLRQNIRNEILYEIIGKALQIALAAGIITVSLIVPTPVTPYLAGYGLLLGLGTSYALYQAIKEYQKVGEGLLEEQGKLTHFMNTKIAVERGNNNYSPSALRSKYGNDSLYNSNSGDLSHYTN